MSIKVLLEDSLKREEVFVYPIIGMGELGNTMLAQIAFNDERMKIHFSPRLWVYVFEDFNHKRVIKSTIKSISGGSYQVSDLDSAKRKLLNGKRYLIVLDDVWDEDKKKWDKLKYTLTQSDIFSKSLKAFSVQYPSLKLDKGPPIWIL